MIIAQSALEAILTKENVHQTAYIIMVIMFIYLFIYQLFWTQASPEGMCTNGTQVPCEVPSLPNPTTRKGWPHHRSLRPLLFSKSDVGSFTSHKNKAGKVLCTVFRPYPTRLESLTICRCLITKAALSPQLFKDPECWSSWGLNPRTPARQTGALPTEPTRRQCKLRMSLIMASGLSSNDSGISRPMLKYWVL